jgi:transposase
MRAYSTDLRERLVAAVARGEQSLRQLAHLFAVSLSCLVRLLQRYRRTGSVAPQPHAGGPARKLDDQAQARLLELVRAQPDATLAELRRRLGVRCCLMTIARALWRHRITRKQKTLRAQERDAPRVKRQRKAFKKKMAGVGIDHLVFVDETGATTAMTRTHGRAPAGQRVQAAAPGVWQNVTLLAGLRTSGVVAPLAVTGATDGAVFQTYVQEVLAPQLQPGDVVVWDNLQPHKSPVVVAAVAAAGARVEPLPVYSPDLAPIEEMFSKVKEALRTAAARTTRTVITAMGKALDKVTHFDILGWFHDRCLYALPQ